MPWAPMTCRNRRRCSSQPPPAAFSRKQQNISITSAKQQSSNTVLHGIHGGELPNLGIPAIVIKNVCILMISGVLPLQRPTPTATALTAAVQPPQTASLAALLQPRHGLRC